MAGSRDRLVVGVDGSDVSTAALEWAVAEARARGCAVHVVYACGEILQGLATVYGRLPVPDREQIVEASERLLAGAISRARDLDPTLAVGGEIVDDAPCSRSRSVLRCW